MQIPPKFEADILAKAGEGLTTRAIAAWLKETHNVDTSHKTVAKLIARHRAERADVAKAIVREQLGKTVNADIARLEQIRAGLAKRAAKAKGPEFAKLTELELKAIDRKLHYAGADTEDPEREHRGGLVVMLPPEDDGRS